MIGGTLLTAGFVVMLKFLVQNEQVLQSLDETDASYVAYLTYHQKQYLTLEDYEFRKQQYAKSLQFIIEHNEENHDYYLGLNHMADWTDEEYNNMLGLQEELPKAKEVLRQDAR